MGMGGRGSPGGGRGRGTVGGLGRLFLYLLQPFSSLSFNSSPLFFFLFTPSSVLRTAAFLCSFPGFYRSDLGFWSFLFCIYYLPAAGAAVTVSFWCCLDSGEGRALRDAGFRARDPLSRGTHVMLGPHVRDVVFVGCEWDGGVREERRVMLMPRRLCRYGRPRIFPSGRRERDICWLCGKLGYIFNRPTYLLFWGGSRRHVVAIKSICFTVCAALGEFKRSGMSIHGCQW